MPMLAIGGGGHGGLGPEQQVVSRYASQVTGKVLRLRSLVT